MKPNFSAVDFHHAVARHFAATGLTMSVRRDMQAWASHMRAVNPFHVSPTHDPMHNDITAGNAFWLQVMQGETTIACIAHRTFVDARLTELMADKSLWYAKSPSDWSFEILDARAVANITGNIGFVGGLWVAEAKRDDGIGTCLSRTCRLIGIVDYEVDWHIAIIKSDNVARGRGRGYLAHQNLHPFMNGHYRPTGLEMELSLASMSHVDVANYLDRSHWPAFIR